MKNKIFILLWAILTAFNVLNYLAWGGVINVFWLSCETLVTYLNIGFTISLIITMLFVNYKSMRSVNKN